MGKHLKGVNLMVRSLKNFLFIIHILLLLPTGFFVLATPIIPGILIIIHMITIYLAQKERLSIRAHIMSIISFIIILPASRSFALYDRTGIVDDFGDGYTILAGILYVILMISTYFIYLKDRRADRRTIGGKRIAANRKATYEQIVENIRQYLAKGYSMTVDTNVLINPLTSRAIYQLVAKGETLYMSRKVFDELDGLKKHRNQTVSRSAQKAFDHFLTYENNIVILPVPQKHYIAKIGLSENNPDDQIIASYYRVARNRKVIFITSDKGALFLANQLQMDTLHLPAL